VKRDWLHLFECPNCGGGLAVDLAEPRQGPEIEYGVLGCGCSHYPVVGGIPIFKSEGRVSAMKQTVDSVLNIGPRVEDLIELIRKGLYEEALLRLLVMPSRYSSRLLALSDCAPKRAQKPFEMWANYLWSRQREKQRDFLIHQHDKATALDMIRFFYQAALQQEVYNYFTCRFAQPRHLAALSLATLFPDSEKPILDLACGFGHLTHFWLISRPNQRVVGVDRNYFQLYVARNWMAPRGEFVCAEADFRLPFAARSFSGVFCSDAFHCFLRRVVCAEEMKRITDDAGIIVLARVANSEVEPHEGYELTAEKYLRLFDGLATRMVSEEALLGAYLKKLGPQLRGPSHLGELAGHKWISLAGSKDSTKLRDYGGFERWPHAVGRPRVNPLYRETSRDSSGTISLSLEFPSKWYEFENSGCLRYMPKTAVLSAEGAKQIQAGIWNGETSALTDKCVLIGVPDRYI
jgi:ubiquinone/menaquinone biosynthesis C-methylase UbiE/uncharacterized protein YbaR (Trm112 family)